MKKINFEEFATIDKNVGIVLALMPSWDEPAHAAAITEKPGVPPGSRLEGMRRLRRVDLNASLVGGVA